MTGNDTNTKGTTMNATKKLTKTEIKKQAVEVVSKMLLGRCSPDRDDVRHLSDDDECNAVLQEVGRVLSKLHKSLKS
jgi:hypothetical protein